MLRTTIPLCLLAPLFVVSPLRAQDSCACAVAACEAMMDAQHRSHDTCTGMARMPASSCANAATNMLSGLRATGGAVPASCGTNAASSPSGGASGPTPLPPTQTPPAAPGATSGSASDSAAPAPLAADPATPSQSSGGRLACVLDHDGKRVIVAGAADSFRVTCSGIPVHGNPLGAGAPATPPQRAADGRTVRITWNNPPGELSPLFASAAWTAPPTAPNPADVRIQATVALVDPAGRSTESVTLVRTVHVVPRHLALEMTSHIVNRCQAITQGTVNVGFDLQCTMSIPLEVANDLSVHGTGGSSCGAGTVTGIALCAPQLESGAEPVSGWSLDAAQGQIDPVTGVMELHLTGQRVGGLLVHIRNGSDQVPHPVALFPRPFTISPDDGSLRTFGSLTTTNIAGGTTAFQIHAH